MKEKNVICSKIENATTSVDKLFNVFSKVLPNHNVDYDEYDRMFFLIFRKLIVRWQGFSTSIKDNQAENGDIFMRAIFELQISLEFILLVLDIDQINNRVTVYYYNTLLQKINSVYEDEERSNEKNELLQNPMYKKVQNDIDTKKLEGKYKYFWANVYCEKKIGNFAELICYLSSYYPIPQTEGYKSFMKMRYNKLSTELHSNDLEIRNVDSNYYQSGYSDKELILVFDTLITFDTVVGDFILYLKKKYASNLLESEKKMIEDLKEDIFITVLKNDTKK